ncbi:hypothetical protein FRC06_002927 [Ceratobasidium sp. 370]|nr:hypothetical protein FRC06_002927 [Ceratobasidium sp. 370]
MYSYNSAPNTNDLISLDLSSTFSLSDVPWTYISGSSAPSSNQGPTVSFHSLTPFNSTTMLLFGGDGGPNMVRPASPDSAWLLDMSSPGAPVWVQKAQGWANEPVRTVHHSAVGSFGRVWITGGEKADGSMLPANGHYVFQPWVPSFDQLSSSIMPPVVSGHASVLLPSGTLLVFGGYNPSTGAMADMGTIWMVDTSQAVPVWSKVAATGAIPPARHSFACTTLGDGRVFIHGGADARTQVVYADAAILDPSQNPMQWTALSGFDQVGARRDHLAVGVGSQVLIAFGYGISSPAPSSLCLFDANDNSWGSSFVPVPISVPAPSSAVATNPGSPGQTATPPNQPTVSQPLPQPTGATPCASCSLGLSTPGPVPTQSSLTSSSVAHSPTATLPPGSADGSSNLKKVAIGAILAVIALVGLVVCGAYFALRRRKPIWKRGDASARLIGGEPGSTGTDEAYITPGEKDAPLAVSNWSTFQSPRRQWTLLGLGSRQVHGRQRFDILHDEDIREFGDVRGSYGSARREASETSNRSAWGGILNASTASLRSVTAALGLGRSARQPSYGSTRPTGRELEDMEKNASNPFLDPAEAGGGPSVPTVALVGVSRPRAVRQESSSSLREVAYPDPFEDPSHYPLMPLEEAGHGGLRPLREGESLVGAFRQQDLEDHGRYDDTILPPTLETYGLAAFGRARSNSDVAPSDESVGSGTARGPGSGTPTVVGSASSHEYRPFTLLSAASAAPVKRSDSWWSRFSVGSLRGDRGAHQEGFSIVRRISRQSEHASRAEAFIDFRDPNPPPPLRMSPIKETGHTPEPSPSDVVQGHSRLPNANGIPLGPHRRSASSLATVKTADSSALERIGQMDIIQRVRTASTQHRQSLSLETSLESAEEQEPSGFIPRRPRLSIVPGSPVGGSKSAAESHQESRASTPPLSEDHGTIVASPTELASSVGHSPSKPTTPRPRQATGKVAERVAAYERRMTESSPVTPTRRSPVGGEATRLNTKSHIRIEYGFVQRPELFVANPDGRASPSS